MSLEDIPGAADERDMLVAFLDHYRETVVRKTEGLTGEQARWVPAETANPVVGIVYHLGWVETWWFREAFLGEGTGRERSDEFWPGPEVTLERAVDHYRRAWARSNEIVRLADSLDDRATLPRLDSLSLRWILLHMLEETARHAGHLDISRELIDGVTGE